MRISDRLFGQSRPRHWYSRSLHSEYSSGKIMGAALDVPEQPMGVRRHARYEKDRFRDEIGLNRYRFSMIAANAMFKDFKGDLLIPFKYYMLSDEKAFLGSQRTGDCVSWGVRGAIDTSRTFEIAEGQFEEYRVRGATAGYYATRGHTGSGASPSRVANAARRVGILLEKKLVSPSGNVWDFTTYNSYYKIGMRLGRNGLPGWITKITSRNAPRDVAKIDTEEEFLAAVMNGYGVTIGSMLGVSKTGGVDGVSFLSRRSGSWAHEMQFGLGIDARSKYHEEILVICTNSWGNWNRISGWPDEYGPKPQGAFVLRMSDVMWAIRNGECHAFSDVKGFRPRLQQTLGAENAI